MFTILIQYHSVGLVTQVSWLRFNIRAGTVFVPWHSTLPKGPPGPPGSPGSGRGAVSEACLVVYAWTLVAPKILPDRNF